MKLFLIYILLLEFSVGALIPKCDLGQLSKVKFILEHYELHQIEASLDGDSFSVFDFIYLHYITPDHHSHEEPADHSKLPFKTFSNSIFFCSSEDVLLNNSSEKGAFKNVVSAYVNLKEQVSDIEIFIPPCILN